MFVIEILLLLWGRDGLDGLVGDPARLHNLAKILGLEYPVRELAME